MATWSRSHGAPAPAPCLVDALAPASVAGDRYGIPRLRRWVRGEEAAVSEEESSEAHLPAQRPSSLQAPRVPEADVDQGRARRAAQPPPQGPRSPVSLIAPLRDRRTLSTVREQGRRGRSGPVTVRHVGSAEGDRCVVAFAIGRRTGTAVVRNRIRRRLRAALGELLAAGAVPAGAMVISAGAPVARAPFPAVRRDLERALVRASTPRPAGA